MSVLLRGAWLCCAALLAYAAQAAPFTFDDVAERARRLAATPYKVAQSNLPRDIRALTYDEYRDVRYRPERNYWRASKLPFELAFFHQGLYYEQPVKIHEVAADSVREIRFDPADFDYGKNKIDIARMHGLGFAGFRVHFPINTSDYKDEVLVFLGASYFRALGKDQRYGLSARGLAIDTALASGEEFPRFTEFWIVRPAHDSKTLTIYALLDSRRVTAAYRFVLQPGVTTAVDVKARLYMRENVTRLGIAPLTSMFLFGDNQRSQFEDYRVQVHDSEGLLIHSGTGEWIWRPLVNPRRLLVTSFALSNVAGFGLMQRDRAFRSYEDLEARYELRPSAWIEPRGTWGAGHVELVQIPTPDETNDNIVAYWVPEQPPQAGQSYDFEYRLRWQKNEQTRPPLSWVTQTRVGHGYMRKRDDTTMLVVDFAGPALAKLPPNAPVEAVVTVDSNGKLVESNAYRNEALGGWRATLRIAQVQPRRPVELRAYLRLGKDTLSETWSYIIPPR